MPKSKSSSSLLSEEGSEEKEGPTREELQAILAERAQRDYSKQTKKLEEQDTVLKIGGAIAGGMLLLSGPGLALTAGALALGYGASERNKTSDERVKAKNDLRQAGVQPNDNYTFWRLPTMESLKGQAAEAVQKGEHALKATGRLAGKLVKKGEHDETEEKHSNSPS